MNNGGRKQENIGLTVGLGSVFSIIAIVVLLIVVFVAAPEEYYVVSGQTDNKVEADNKEEASEKETVDGSLAFTANTYEVEANKDVDMSQYLQCSGIELADVTWSSDSDKMYVGSDGHISLHENGIECSVLA